MYSKSSFLFAILFLMGATTRTSLGATPILIQDIILPDAHHPTALILERNYGRVYEIKNPTSISGKADLAAAQLARDTGSTLSFNLSINEKTVSNLQLLETAQHTEATASAEKFVAATDVDATPAEYVPTVLQNDRPFLKKIFNELTPDSNFQLKSQCYRRAHTWAYDMYDYERVNSMKAFLFFTRKYIRENNYDWWFHVAPFVYFKAGDGKTYEVVLDKTFAEGGGVEMTEWSHMFVGANVNCDEAKKYQDFEAAQDSANCLIRKVPMYYYQPENVEALDKEGKVLTGFITSELYDMSAQSWKKRKVNQD